MHIVDLNLFPEEAYNTDLLYKAAAKELNIDVNSLSCVRIMRSAIDARKGRPIVRLRLQIFINESITSPYENDFYYEDVSQNKEVIVVGSGPGGLFAALRLIELGIRPIVIERGNDVKQRRRDVAQLCKNEGLNLDSNYCFGEGGAGTFSDGKLMTRSSKRGNIRRILEIFHLHGANDNILYESHPHIGTDCLPAIIANIRNRIIDCGGEVVFGSKVVELLISDGAVKGVVCDKGEKYLADDVILATGHSARDIYQMLYKQNVALQPKGMAIGVRVEHPQQLIDSIQYHCRKRGLLPAASYSLVAQVNKHNRGVYSFCMCPGGVIVPSTTESNAIVVNGMSSSKRASSFANSGIAVELRVADYSKHASAGVLAGMRLQQEIEEMAFINGGGGMVAPAQRLADFVKGKMSFDLPKCSYMPGVISSPLHFWLPSVISESLREGFKLFDHKMHGFLTNEAIIVGVESRTSSPIRIPRTENYEHIQISGLYPCGEGAGYAGGITSSAMDGENCANAIGRKYNLL